MELTPEIQTLTASLETPFLLLDCDIIRRNYRRLKESVNYSAIYYAVKANPHQRILQVLKEEGSSFDIASIGELDVLLELGVEPEKISFGNTIKKVPHIKYAFEKGVRLFVADDAAEVEKIAIHAPDSKIFIRLQMSESDSDWPLTKKFGTNMEKAREMLVLSKELGLIPYGLSFHVGSQCYDKYIWKSALLKVQDIFEDLRDKDGITLEFINTGGGMPIQHVRPIPEIEEIAEVINNTVEEYFDEYPNIVVACEPGRSMIGDAGILVAEAVLVAERERSTWCYLDAGVFHGLMETIQDFAYEIVIPGRDGEEELFTLSGPSCDSVDTMYDDIYLPEDIQAGDRFYFINTGAYTTGYASHFNGIEPPKTYFMKDLKGE